jgi:hypothetical protein
MSELDQIKTLWRKESDRYEHELERSNVIIAEYKQICNKLSNKIEKWSQFKKSYESRGKAYVLCPACVEANRFDGESPQTGSNQTSENDGSAKLVLNEEERNHSSAGGSTSSSRTASTSNNDSFDNIDDLNKKVDQINDSLLASNKDNLDKIKGLEYELARVKLELVDAQCKNQEYDHKLKGYTCAGAANSSVASSNGTTATNASGGTAAPVHELVSTRSNSTSSQVFYDNQLTTPSNRSSSSFGSNSTINSNPGGNAQQNGNNWLSKTFTQFKEATNQVVQKAQKTSKISTVAPLILDQLKN